MREKIPEHYCPKQGYKCEITDTAVVMVLYIWFLSLLTDILFSLSTWYILYKIFLSVPQLECLWNQLYLLKNFWIQQNLCCNWCKRSEVFPSSKWLSQFGSRDLEQWSLLGYLHLPSAPMNFTLVITATLSKSGDWNSHLF